jgi:hypothetical protein
MASLLAMMSLSCEVLPEFSRQTPQLTPSSSATQNFTDEQINNYAHTVLEIENQREKAYQRIQEIIDGSPPDIACDQGDTLKKLPKEAQEVAVEYCINSQQIAQKNGLTEAQFNSITLRLQSDPDLKIRIQNAMIYIQRKQQKSNES